MRWYGYVETPEWLDIREQGGLRAGGNSCGRGKWIARHEGHAWTWGRLLDTRFPGHVIVLEVVEEAVANACPGPRILDGIGEAAYIRGQDLVQVSIVEAVEWVR